MLSVDVCTFGCSSHLLGRVISDCSRTLRDLTLIVIYRACNFFQRIESMRWTAYLDECLCVLEEKEDSPTDVLLVQLVRIQLLTNRILQAPWPDESYMLDGTSRLPHDAYIQIFELQLEEVKRSIPSTLISNGI